MASVNDKITDTRNAARPVTASVSSPRAAGGTTLSCDSLTGWPTASKVHFVTYTVDSNNNPVVGSQLDCIGIVSGSTIGSFDVIDGTDAGNSIGDKVEMLPTAAWAQDLADSLTVGHTRTGAHVSNLPLTSPVLTTPVIADFTSAAHTHAGASTGGQLVGSDALTANSVTPAQMLGVDIFGVTTAMSGSVPTAGSGQFYMQAGKSSVTFSSNAADITFPTAFPNWTLTVLIANATNTASPGTISVNNSNVSASAFRAQCGADGAAVVSWIAIGF